MFVDNEPYEYEAVCDCCGKIMDDADFDFRHKWVSHIHPKCYYDMLDEDGLLPDNIPIYFNHLYKENWEEIMDKRISDG